MPDPEDDLEKYARSGCETAFRGVIDRYGALVLHAARRRIRDAGLAEELAQNVFVLLSRKAGKVAKYRSVSAWLYESTRLEAAKLLRGQARHQRRVEALAHEPQDQLMNDDSDFRNLLPNLEDALDSLKAAERKILLSRFFEEKSFREIATITGKSESACKMSLSRALEKLRRNLQARGISVTVITLGAFLQTEWAKAAPVTTLASISNHVVKASPGSAISKAVMMISPYKVLPITVVVLLVGLCIQMVMEQEPPEEQEAPGKSVIEEGAPGRRTFDSSSHLRVGRKELVKADPIPHEVNDLPNFYLPAMKLENTNLAEAMDVLIARYHEVCRETGELALPIVWELEGKARPIEVLKLGNGDLMSSCRLIAFFSETSLEVDGHRFVFKEIEGGPVETRRWNVPPSFRSYFRDLISEYVELPPDVFEPLELTEAPLPGDLPQGSARRLVGPKIGDLFRAAGLLGEGETLSFLAGSGQLISEAGGRHSALIDAVVNNSMRAMPVQIRYSARRISNGESEDLPSIVARPGQVATLEVGKEYIDREFQDGAPVVAWVGVRLQVEPELYGFGDRTEVTYTYTKEPSEENLEVFEKTGRLDDLDLEEFRIEGQIAVRSANERYNRLPQEFFGTDRDGNELGLSYIGEKIDSAGRPLNPPERQRSE